MPDGADLAAQAGVWFVEDAVVLWLTMLSALGADPLKEHMAGHFADASDAVWYVSQGDLDKARAELAGLQHPTAGEIPPELKVYADGMRKAADQAAGATTIDQAASRLGDLAVSCAACHVAAGRGPTPSKQQTSLPGPDDVRGRHAWSTYGMWASLVAPEVIWWEQATGMLVVPPVAEAPVEVGRLIKAYEATADRAKSAADTLAQARVFGEVLGSCAACHQALEVQRP